MAGLREQWRRSARQAIQERALDLFDARGFASVTIEEIAKAAEVSPSSVYRFFGTKEGLVVADEFDTMSPGTIAQMVDPSDPVGSLLELVREYERQGRQASDASDGERGPWRRVRYFFTEPSIRSAVLSALDRAAQRIAPLLEGEALSVTQARVASGALAFGYFAALEQWYDDGGERSIASYVEEGLAPLRTSLANGG